ncbi:unnamed protein product [Allacma fusca]|uniref:ATP-dependent (S)-NAD(P)H-hydrate dehydratase n=1 Tax=Allacma fusca TaxID=39272 RepID=A0A8J2Q7U1_9HEXA|nr:unnamed protein product [Allacma fusca]
MRFPFGIVHTDMRFGVEGAECSSTLGGSHGFLQSAILELTDSKTYHWGLGIDVEEKKEQFGEHVNYAMRILQGASASRGSYGGRVSTLRFVHWATSAAQLLLSSRGRGKTSPSDIRNSSGPHGFSVDNNSFVTSRAENVVGRQVVSSVPYSTSTTMSNTPVGSDEALLASARAFIPSLTNAMHKGQAGRIGVIGGSEEYTGAPYFSAISALKVGADLAHVFCVKPAATVIKTYSPELIVHPLLDLENAVEAIMEWVPRMHSFVIGPGLGRDPKILETVAILIEKLKELEKPMIIDADGLFLITDRPQLIQSYSKAILTPNSVEFSRLCTVVLGGEVKPAPSASAEKVRELSTALGFVTILHKGATDVASNGRLTVCCAGGGSNRRCGGQGDLLAGALAVLFQWALAYGDRGGAPAPPELLAAYGACRLTRPRTNVTVSSEFFANFSRPCLKHFGTVSILFILGPDMKMGHPLYSDPHRCLDIVTISSRTFLSMEFQNSFHLARTT